MKTMTCSKCGEQHELFYQKQVNGSTHLIYHCGKGTTYAPYVPGLDIPVVESKKLKESKEFDLFKKLP